MKPYNVIDLEQGTPEWLRFREEHIGSSDAPVIAGKSPWKTPYKLYQQKLGIAPPDAENDAMRRGKALESEAREVLSNHIGVALHPAVVESKALPWMSASLDGISACGSVVCEIKCPGAEDHAIAKRGLVPEKYVPQLFHILITLDSVEKLLYWSYSGQSDDHVLLEFTRHPDDELTLIDQEKAFYNCLQRFQEPPLTDRDYSLRDDMEWRLCCHEYAQAAAAVKQWEEKQEKARQNLIKLSSGFNTKGGGVRLTKIHRRGSINYSAIPVLAEMDLEPYRKPATESWRINVE